MLDQEDRDYIVKELFKQIDQRINIFLDRHSRQMIEDTIVNLYHKGLTNISQDVIVGLIRNGLKGS